MTDLGTVRSNPRAVAGWILLSSLAIAGIASSLTGALVWGGFLVAIALVAALPAVVRRSWGETVPVSLLGFALVAGVARTLGVYSEHAGYLAIVALALIVVVELDAFTRVELSRRFAVVFAVMLTMAFQGVWIVAQNVSDAWLGTSLLGSQTELQWDIVAVTLVAVAIGVVYLGLAREVGSGGAVSVPEGRGGS